MKGNAKLTPIRSQAAKYPDPRQVDLESFTITYRPKNKSWSQQDMELVRRYYKRVPLPKLAEKLNRSVGSVQSQAQVLRSRGIKLECDK